MRERMLNADEPGPDEDRSGEPKNPKRRDDQRQKKVLDDVSAEKILIGERIEGRSKVDQQEKGRGNERERLQWSAPADKSQVSGYESGASNEDGGFPIPAHKNVQRYTTAKIASQTASTKYQ